MGFVIRRAEIALALLLAGASPAASQSPATQAFLANLTPNVDFLDRSSRFALTNSKNARLKAFAWSEAREQTLAANALYDWTQADANPMIASTATLDQTPTGTTPQGGGPAVADPATTDDRLPHGQEDLDSLEGLDGKDFDAEYKDKQRDALGQVEADYEDYIAKGDDPTLKALAARELPKIEKRLEQLDKL